MVSGIILAGGNSVRFGTGKNKTLTLLSGKPVLYYGLKVLFESKIIDEVIIAAREGEVEPVRKLAESLSPNKPYQIVTGGAERTDSVHNALAAAKGEKVLIHDGARPLVTEEMLVDCLEALKEAPGATAAIPCVDTIKLTDANGFVTETTDRSHTFRIQTPQGFDRKLLLKLHQDPALANGVTDDCMLLEKAGYPVKLTKGSPFNIKITAFEDQFTAEFFLSRMRLSPNQI